ncbi:MAG: hypothetical protein V4675_19185 [Verrucomicrobiota bacterium]
MNLSSTCFSRPALTVAMAGLVSLLARHAVQAETWVPTAAGTFSWNDTTNWSPATVPNAADAVANLNINITGAQIINLDAPITVGTLNLGDSTTGFFTQTINPGTGGSLTFDVASGSAVLARTITTNPGVSDTISAGITLNDNLTARVPFVGGGNGIILSGAIGGTGGITLTNPTLPATAGGSTQILDLRSTANSFTGDMAVGNGTVIYRGDVIASTNGGLGNSATAVRLGGASSLAGTGTPSFVSNTTAELRLQASDDSANYTFARDLDLSGSTGNAAATGRVRFSIAGDGAGGLNTNTLTVSGNVILPELETAGARGVEFFAARQGQTIRFTGGISVGAGGSGAAGFIFWGPGGAGAATVDGRTNGTYRFSNVARNYTNPQNLTNGTAIIEGTVGAVGLDSPIGTQTLLLSDGNGGNMFSANQSGAVRRVFLETPGTSFDRTLNPAGGSSSNLGTAANISGVLPAVFQPLYGNSGTVNLLNGYEFGGLNTSGTVTFNGTIAGANVNAPATGSAAGAGGTNIISVINNVALSAVGGGTVNFTEVISGATGVTPGSTAPGASVGTANLTRITINQFRNHPNLDSNVDGQPDANANLLVGTATTGTVILSGVNTYGGTTEVLGGTLLVNGSIAGDTVTVAAGTTLGGSGTINVGVAASTVQINGTLAPGNSAGIITTNKPLSFNGTSIFAAEINGTTAGTGYDQLAVGDPATVSIAGTSVINLSLGYAPAPAAMFTLIDNAGTVPITGTFSNLADDSTVTLSYLGNNYDFTADYQGGTGNDLVLTALIPEVSSSLLALTGVALFTLRRRRRQ